MDTSAMVKKISILAIGIIVALLIIATLRLTRRGKYNEYRESNLDEWEEHLSSGQSVTRMYLRLEFKFFLRPPRLLAEDEGIKSESDWIAYMRDYALKFHKQCYGVVPKWLDEEFPLPKNGEDIETNPEKAQ